jgi:hypothetical protein
MLYQIFTVRTLVKFKRNQTTGASRLEVLSKTRDLVCISTKETFNSYPGRGLQWPRGDYD